jgi:hypothetical protein
MPDLYLGKIPIIYRSLNEGFVRGTPDPAHLSTGAVPRDFDVDPVLMRDSPAGMAIIPQSEWDARHAEQLATKSSLLHMYLPGDMSRPAFDFLDQNGFPDCWYHSTAQAAMMAYLAAGLPVPRLNAVAGATLLNRTDGGWCGLSMKHLREHGCPVVGTGPGQWPYQSRRGQDTPELRANMARHKSAEDWYDFGRREYDQQYDQQFSANQLATCGFQNWPAPSDYNEFGHSMLTLGWAKIEAGHWGPVTLNSWRQFGYFGLCVLADRVPDNACALRAMTPTVN